MEFLKRLFLQKYQISAIKIETLPASGSQRQYFRLSNGQKTAIGVYNLNAVENKTFIAYSRHFKHHGVKVPEIYAVDEANFGYLQQDLGNTSLLDFVMAQQNNPKEIEYAYQKALSQLAYMQLYAGVDLDFSVAGAYHHFDKTVMGWDLNYFKYWLLMPSKISFDEYKLELDFQKLVSQLEQANQAYFLFRDFQSRNIMIYENNLYFIDYQGAKQGALQYDVASLLYQSKANLSADLREKLLSFYIQQANKYVHFEELEFRQQYERYVLLRLLQVLGSYGYRGFYEQKPHFISSLPFALSNLKHIQQQKSYLFAQLPQLNAVLSALIDKFV
jgi:aminoglycoside/choline kinase family phosphotransferase